jgi:hypothetical protein
MTTVFLGRGRNEKRISVTTRELSTHLLVLGGSGRGKSVFLEHFIRQVMREAGCFVLDPHGSLAEAIVSGLASKKASRRVHLIEPRIERWTTGFNPLAFPAAHLTAGVESVVAAFSAAWGHEDLHERPRLRRALAGILYLLAAHQLTLADAVSLFAPNAKGLRLRLAQGLPDPFFKNEWADFNAMTETERREFFESSLNRLGPLVSSERIRAMLGQTERVIDFGQAMDQGEIVIANLAPGPAFTVGDAQVVGTLLLNAIAQQALLRSLRAPRPFFVIVDEAYRFLSRDCETLIDQTRKMGVHLILSLQRLGQLAEKGEALASAVRGIQSKVAFGGLTVDDATLLADELYMGQHNLERTKRRITTPVTVGHETRWLLSESDTDSELTNWSDTETDGENESEDTSIDMDVETETPRRKHSGKSVGKSRTKAHTTGGARTSAYTSGRHEAMVAKIEERATHTYTLEEHRHLRAVTLKRLPVGNAVVKILDRPAMRARIPAPARGAARVRTELYRARLHAQSPSATRTEQALEDIEARRKKLNPADAIPTAPTYGRRIKRRDGGEDRGSS